MRVQSGTLHGFDDATKKNRTVRLGASQSVFREGAEHGTRGACAPQTY